MPLEEGPQSSAKDVERRPADMSGRTCRGEEPIAGPSCSQRQGYCSCCQVLYNSVEQHILSAQHRDVVRVARTNVSSGSLLERFLQDVLQHHPHHYSDTRPTHADLPSLTTPLVPKEELSEVYCDSDDDGVSVGTREEMPTSDEDSCQMLQIAASTPAVTTDLTAATTLLQTTCQIRKKDPEPPPPEKYSPTQGFLHRTSDSSVNDQPHTSKLTLPVQRENSQTHPSGHPCASEGPLLAKAEKAEHRKAHRKTNKDKEESTSFIASQAPCITSKDQSATFKPVAEESPAWILAVPPWKGPHREQTFSHLSDQIQDVIEEVIETYCYGRNLNVDQQEDDGSFLVNPQPMSESKSSEEWDNAIQTALGRAKGQEKNLAELLEVHINLKDQEYQTFLDTALNTVVMSMNKGPEGTAECAADEVFPNLPHIPQSFVGKTWMQVMFEDDMKIDSIVKEFQQGEFRCYFDSESLARLGKHSKKRRKKRNQDKKDKEDIAGCEPADMLPLMEHNEDPNLPIALFKKTRRKTYRLASRCRVVKVSHGTQTIPLSCPVVRPKATQETVPSSHSQEQCPNPEKTPDMKTRLCALKLPASYCKIMSPLQPKTVVYVLSSPDGGQGISTPSPIKKVGRKRKSCDGECGLKYKYKKTPLKFYDPLTNRILKSPPKGMSSLPNSKSLSHVRQLFRSLSPDINKERQDLEQGQSSGVSRKSRGRSSMVDLRTSTSGSCLESGGPSEPGSSLSSSRRALFTRSSISSSSCFLLGHLTPSVSHVDDSPKALSHSCTGSSYKVTGSQQKERHKQGAVDQTPLRRSSRRVRCLTPAKRPSAPPYRTKRKSTKPQAKAKSQTVRSQISAECRTSPRNKTPARVSLRSSASSKLAIQPVIAPSSKNIHTMLTASQQKRTRGRTTTVHIAN